MPTRADICAEALTWLGTPWHHRQLMKGAGVDCCRLIEGIGKSLGVMPHAWQPPMYSADAHLHSDRELVRETLEDWGAVCVPLAEKQPGDCLLFVFGRSCAHAGIYMPHNRVLHAVRVYKRVLMTTLSGDWLARLRYAYQFPGLTEDACAS